MDMSIKIDKIILTAKGKVLKKKRKEDPHETRRRITKSITIHRNAMVYGTYEVKQAGRDDSSVKGTSIKVDLPQISFELNSVVNTSLGTISTAVVREEVRGYLAKKGFKVAGYQVTAANVTRKRNAL